MRKFKKAIAFTLTALLTLSSLGTTTAEAKGGKPDKPNSNYPANHYYDNEFYEEGTWDPHHYVFVSATEATCTSPATRTYKCDIEIDKEWVYDVGWWEPLNGHWEYEICNSPITITDPSGALADHDYKTVYDKVDATCTDTGVEAVLKCANCEAVTGGAIIPAKGHNYEEVADSAKAATCTEDGNETVLKCANCDAVTGGAIIPATDHKYEEVADSAKAATCTEDGNETVLKCANCDAVTGGAIIPATGHKYEEVADSAKAATCTEDGNETVLKCANCEAVTGGAIIPAKGHNYEEVADSAKAATCTENGNETVLKCTKCDAVTGGAIISATGHVWGEWVNADETSGKGKRVCEKDSSHVEYMDAISTGFYVLLEGTTYGEKNGVDKSFSSDLFVTVLKEGKLRFDAVGTNSIDDIPKAFVVSPTIEQVYAAIEKAVDSGKKIYTTDGKELTKKILQHNTNIPVTWYVLKQQTDGWHVDGVASLKELAKVNVNYVVDKETFTASILKGTAETEAKTPAPVKDASEAVINYENQKGLEFTGWVLQENGSFENGEIVADITFVAEFQEIKTTTPAPTANPVPPTVPSTPISTPVPSTPVPTTTVEPTPVPTTVPTTEPTPVPTTVPTTEPTPVPTTEPTVVPTEEPEEIEIEDEENPEGLPEVTPGAEPEETPEDTPEVPDEKSDVEPEVDPEEEIDIADEETPEGTPEIEIEDEENALGDVDVLPKTGLASTTVFFMAGAVLVLAGVVVVARKKEENA